MADKSYADCVKAIQECVKQLEDFKKKTDDLGLKMEINEAIIALNSYSCRISYRWGISF